MPAGSATAAAARGAPAAAAASDTPPRTTPLPRARSVARAGVALAALFAALVALRLHGFSISVWREWTDRSPPEELLLGRPQPLRIDDYAVVLPLAFAQERHVPPFPVVNTTIGAGQNMLLPFSLPVRHPLALLRPDTWGFFLGAETGMAWRWNARLLGLFGAAWLLLLAVTGGDARLAAAGAVVVTASPFFQFWGLRPAPVAIHAALGVVAALAVAFARRPAAIVGGGLVLGWAAAGFALALYPPFQVPLAYLATLVAAALAVAHRDALDLRARLGWRALALALAALVLAAAAALFLGAAGDAALRMRETVYPGQRVSLGGNRALPALFAANAGVPLLAADYGPVLQNAAEAAGFWLLAPVLLVPAIARAAAARRRPDPVVVALAAAWLALAVHAAVGVPGWLARASGWSYVPGHRSVIALGFADALLAARLLREGPLAAGPARLALAFGWGAAIAACGLALALPGVPPAGVLAFAAGNAGIAWLALAPRRPWHALAAAAAGSALVCAWFNPLVRGGADALRENAVARAVREVDAAHGGATVWAAFGPVGLANLFRALGVRSVNGVHPVPQLELWRALDPEGRHAGVYNRYAHVLFEAGADPEPRFELAGSDAFRVVVHPASPALAKLGVTHVLVEGRTARMLAARGGAVVERSAGPYQLLRAPWAGAPAEAGAAAAGAQPGPRGAPREDPPVEPRERVPPAP